MGFLLDLGVREQVKVKKKAATKKGLGCEFCPRNKVKGISKIMGVVTGKKIMIWGQSPGPDENRVGKELVGKAGRWWWAELEKVGITRDQCDIQNVVRCWPADRDIEGGWEMRDPTKEERRCCSVYTTEAIEKSRARVWLVLGKIAHEQLFGKKKKRDPIFYHGDVKVFLLDHPSFFLRGGGTDGKRRLRLFREYLKLAKEHLSSKGNSRFSFLEEQDYKMVRTKDQAVAAAKEILRYARKGCRVAWDEEDDSPEEFAKVLSERQITEYQMVSDGDRVLLCVGACPKPGMSRVFVLDHPENDVPLPEKQAVWKVVVRLLQDIHEKTMHHGNHDCGIFKRIMKADTLGFHFDTQYGEYMADPAQRGYSLGDIVSRKLPRFSGYKEIMSDAVPKGMTVEEGREVGEFHLSRTPLKKMVLYNGADCDVTKRIEISVKKKVPAALVSVYTDAAFILDEMQVFGPLLDRTQAERLERLYPMRRTQLIQKLRRIAGNPQLNPNSQQQMVNLLYNDLGIPPIKGEEEKPTTQKETLALLKQRKKKYPAVEALVEWREIKNRLERVDAFKRSADAHRGRVTTVWWLTGARTGRMSSGGGRRKDKRNLGNLQNIPGRSEIKNMLVSDLEWRAFLDKVQQVGLDRFFSKYIDSEWFDFELFVALDYSQMELRILAQVTGEPELLKAFAAGKDIHAAVGSQWSGWKFKEIQTDDRIRRIVKGFHFGIIYGLTLDGLWLDLRAQGVAIERAKLKGMYDQYFETYREVSRYLKETPDFALENGYVENIFGFKTPIEVKQYGEGSFWRNQAVNSPIQGGAHQVLLCALALMKRERKRYQLLQPQLEVHDSLVTVSRLRAVLETIKVAKQLMETTVAEMTSREFGIKWRVPLVAEAKIGFRFGGMVALGDSLKDTIGKVVELSLKQDEDMKAMYRKYKAA